MNVLVSGAGGNLGSCVVDMLQSTGKNVIGIYGTESKLNADKREIAKYAVDLMDPDDSKKTLNEIISKKGNIDAAVLTVGGFAMGNLKETTTKDIHDQIKLNFDTAYHLVQPLLEHMKKQGQIFLIGAKPALNINELKGKLAYGIAKSMIFTLAEVINADSDKHGINCTVVVPSIIDTKPNRENMPNSDFSDWVTPKEIAETINYYIDHPYLKEAVIKAYGKV